MWAGRAVRPCIAFCQIRRFANMPRYVPSCDTAQQCDLAWNRPKFLPPYPPCIFETSQVLYTVVQTGPRPNAFGSWPGNPARSSKQCSYKQQTYMHISSWRAHPLHVLSHSRSPISFPSCTVP